MNEMTQILEGYWETFLVLVPKIAIALIILVIMVLIGDKISRLITKGASSRIDDPLLARFLGRLSKWSLIVAGIILGMFVLGLGGIAGGMIAGAGVSAIIIGFAFKDIGENFLAGIILAFARPFNIGDKVETSGTFGIVQALDLRNTHIKTFDGKDVYVPNASVIKTPLINYTRDGFLRYEFLIGIDYGDDVEKARKVIIKAISTVDGVLGGLRAPEVYVEELAASTINMRVFFWVDTFDYRKDDLEIQSDVMVEAKKALIENEITLPADILELKIYNEKHPIPIKIMRCNRNDREE